MYSLDTNTCIRAINGRSPQVRVRLLRIPAAEIIVCSIVRNELFYGSARSQTPQRSREKQAWFLDPFGTQAFDDAAAERYGTLRAMLERAGTPIGPLDMQIAAIARL